MPRSAGTKASMVFTIIGGALILLGGIYSAVIPSVLGSNSIYVRYQTALYLQGASAFYAMGAIGIVFGLAIIASGILIRAADTAKIRKLSTITVALGVLSVFGGSGFFIGMVLAIIGGIFGLLHKG